MDAWKITLNGHMIDMVFYDKGITAEEVKKSLIDHDGFDPRINVRKSKQDCY